MSRLEQLKNRRRKNILKAIANCLAIILVIGATQTMSTYSLFTTGEKHIGSDLILNTGTIGINVGDGFKDKVLTKGKEFIYNFDIENTGSLKEELSLKLTCSDKDIAKLITYRLELRDSKNTIIKTIGSSTKPKTLSELIDKEIKLENFTLKPGKSNAIKAKVILTVDSKIDNKSLLKLGLKKFEIYLSTTASQIKIKEEFEGFKAMYNQTSDFTANLTNATENASLTVNFEDSHKTISMSLPMTNYKKISTIEQLYNSGDLINVNTIVDRSWLGNTLKIKKVTEFTAIDEKFNDDKLTLKFNYEDGTTGTLYIVFKYPRILGTRHLMAGYYYEEQADSKTTVVNENLDESKDIQPSKEEVEIPNESEVIELPKEEVEIPNEPEVIETPNEEIEEPSEPEVIESPKEEVEEPSESGAVVPNQMDIVAQKKEEDVE